MSTYSQSHREYYLRNREKILAQRGERERAYLATPKGKYSIQKRHAKQRGIAWEFTFDSWWAFWQESGKWDERGDCSGKYCMSRHGDTGPYSPENVYINLFEANTKEVYDRNGVNEKGQFNEGSL